MGSEKKRPGAGHSSGRDAATHGYDSGNEGGHACSFRTLLPPHRPAYRRGMIRHRQGSDFLLITQDDHARLSGRFAEHLGNDRFARPEPRPQTLRGIALHDCGWPLHDRRPTLNRTGSRCTCWSRR